VVRCLWFLIKEQIIWLVNGLLKHFILLMLIGVQAMAPFVHGHAFGMDGEHTSGPHVHQQDFVPFAPIVSLVPTHADQSATAVSSVRAQDSFQNFEGMVVNIASGINRNDRLDIATILIVVLSFFCLFSKTGLIVARNSFQIVSFKSHFSSPLNPRAPPYPLN
jgi:hypothetical protein